MDNVVTLLYFWLVQETEISQREESDFFLEIDFYMKKHCISTGTWVKYRNYHIVMRKNFEPLWSKFS